MHSTVHCQSARNFAIVEASPVDGLKVESYSPRLSAGPHPLLQRLPRQNKKQREGLSLLAATMLDVRSTNLMDLSVSLPRASECVDMRYQWIARLLGNELVDTDWVMAPFATEVLQRAAGGGKRLVLIIDQSKANKIQQAIVVAVRVGGRSLPIAWRVKETEGAIGFYEQKAALDYGLRWGIEAMFTDFKSRGFGLEDSQLHHGAQRRRRRV